jgi:4-hydroxythreonine-4-phosphate dehydrogenase
MSHDHPTIAVTMGDPAGIGPEVVVKALSDLEVRRLARWVIVGEEWIIRELGALADLGRIETAADLATALERSDVVVLNCGLLSPAERVIGQLSAACGRAGLEYVRIATQLCLDGRAQAIVTAPLNKEAVALTDRTFRGHTEFLAQLCGALEPRLFLYNQRLCVVHVSTHCSLVEATRLTIERVATTIEMGHVAMTRLGFPAPRIALCGLNPHAGENGLFGDEERRLIVPALERARSLGLVCAGPLPADTLFMQAVRGKYDLVVAMYHDQGHIPMKLLDFEHTVNVTLGLPIIRTSVDHGTAFDIAGKHLASADNMKTAMRLARELARMEA